MYIVLVDDIKKMSVHVSRYAIYTMCLSCTKPRYFIKTHSTIPTTLHVVLINMYVAWRNYPNQGRTSNVSNLISASD